MKHRISEDRISGSVHEALDVSCACPHCLKVVEFTFPVVNATRNFVEEMRDERRRSDELAARWREQQDPKRHEKVTAMYLEALEEWA